MTSAWRQVSKCRRRPQGNVDLLFCGVSEAVSSGKVVVTASHWFSGPKFYLKVNFCQIMKFLGRPDFTVWGSVLSRWAKPCQETFTSPSGRSCPRATSWWRGLDVPGVSGDCFTLMQGYHSWSTNFEDVRVVWKMSKHLKPGKICLENVDDHVLWVTLSTYVIGCCLVTQVHSWSHLK
jgi:hypothetical protein